MVDAIGEISEEPNRVEVLPDEVTRVEVQAKARPVPDCLKCPLRCPVVVCDLARVNFVRKSNADLVEHIDYRVPAACKVGIAIVYHRSRHWRKAGNGDPDAGPG